MLTICHSLNSLGMRPAVGWQAWLINEMCYGIIIILSSYLLFTYFFLSSVSRSLVRHWISYESFLKNDTVH